MTDVIANVEAKNGLNDDDRRGAAERMLAQGIANAAEPVRQAARVECRCRRGLASDPEHAKCQDPRLEQLEKELALYRTAMSQLPPPPPLKLDLGCGTRKREGFTGVDERQFPGVDIVADLNGTWPWPDASVDEVHCSHMLEHVPGPRRPHFFNELYRVLKPKATALFYTPHWASERAYGDVTHQWPPVVPMFWAYLDKEWRKANAPHCGFTCDFSHAALIHVAPHPFLQGRNQQFMEIALSHGINTGSDMQCTITKVVRP